MEEAQEVVNEGTETVPEESTPSKEVPTAETPSESENEAEVPVEDDKQLPFGKHPRWQKMVSSNRELKQKISELEQRYSGFNDQEIAGFKAIKGWFEQDPRNIEAFQQLFTRGAAGETNEPKPEAKDPYAAWEPEVAERFRTVDELKTKLADFERREQERQIQEITRQVDGTFVNRLKDDGYLNEKGSYKDKDVGEMIEDACFARLCKIARDPQRPTPDEVNKAYDFVRSGLSSAEKNGIKKVSNPPVAPPTGSKTVSVPAGKRRLDTDEGRIAFLTRSLGE